MPTIRHAWRVPRHYDPITLLYRLSIRVAKLPLVHRVTASRVSEDETRISREMYSHTPRDGPIFVAVRAFHPTVCAP